MNDINHYYLSICNYLMPICIIVVVFVGNLRSLWTGMCSLCTCLIFSSARCRSFGRNTLEEFCINKGLMCWLASWRLQMSKFVNALKHPDIYICIK